MFSFQPFVDVCLQHGNVTEAQRYLPRVEEHHIVKYYVKAKLFSEAAQIAFQRKDKQALLLIQARCSSNKSLVDHINTLMANLTNPEGFLKR